MRALLGVLVGLPLTLLAGYQCAPKRAATAPTIGDARPAPPVSAAPGLKSRVTDGSTEMQSGRLVDGLAIRWQGSIPTNELADSVQVSGGFLARTTTGNLIRLDSRLHLIRVARFFPPLTTLAGVRGAIWAGSEDGGIHTIDPDNLSAREIARVDGVPVWIGSRTVDGRPATPVVVARGLGAGRPTSPLILDVARGREWPFTARGGSAFFLDERGRLWIGGDRGEWGGTLDWVDVDSGSAGAASETPLDGVYAIGAWPGGPVLTWGGMDHMGFGRATVTDAYSGRPLFRHESGFRDEPKDSDGPRYPITQVVDERGDGQSIVVFAFDGVFRTDPSFGAWTRLGQLDVRYSSGRPDAVGSYPAVRAVHVLGPGHFMLATGADGYVEFDQGRCIPHALAGEPPIRGLQEIENTKDGLLFVNQDGSETFWLRNGLWEPGRFDPPIANVCNGEGGFNECSQRWEERRVLLSPDGTPFVMIGTNVHPGPRAFVRWRNGQAEVVDHSGKHDMPDEVEATFVTPDGTFWNAWDGIAYFAGEQWQMASARPGGTESVPFHLRAIRTSGPPWFLVARGIGTMLRLSYGPGFTNVRMDRIKPEGVTDAVPLDDTHILVASKEGLQVYATNLNTFSRWTGPSPSGRVDRLTRDGRGRLWMAGRGLWLVDADGKQLHDVGSLDITAGEIFSMAPDPSHRDGVVFVTWNDEVVFVQAE